MTTQLSTIQFHSQTLTTFEQNNIHYVAMRPICENIGLNWASQYQCIQRDEVLNSTVVMITTVSNDEKDREMLCIPIDYLNGWLFGIDVKRVKPEIRETLITYKKEYYKALSDYWFKGKAERKLSVQTDEDALDVIVNLYQSLNGAYEMGEKLRNQFPHIARSINSELGGYYIHNLHYPTQQALEKARKFVQAKSNG